MQPLISFFQNFTFLDSILFVVLALSAVEGYALGVVLATFDLVKFVLSFIAGLKFYSLMAIPFEQIFHISKGYANAIGFFVSAFVTELVLHFLLRKFVKKVNSSEFFQKSGLPSLNNIFGLLPGFLSGAVLLMFILTVVITLPVSPFLKNLVNSSHIGSFLVSRSQVIERQVAGAFGGAANDTLNFLTIEPKSNSSVSLGFHTEGSVDPVSETKMLTLVNVERAKAGQGSLTMDTQLQKLARSYAEEMLTRGYFSHYTPEGLSPFDRMSQADIVFSYAGENLAFSPNVDLAMQGLMNSPGHRANILSPNFHRVGIGVMDAGIYGEMFVQEFTD